ncbi:MAG TPA: RNase H family protein [Chloroflexota bacterium]|nr:RNase H family protein [Chloroflexota bacterium]
MSAVVAKRAFGTRDLDEFAAVMAELRIELEAPTESGEYVAHTDGACLGNPEGPGGWAAVVERLMVVADGPRVLAEAGAARLLNLSENVWLLYGHLSSTSNNRAEALGVLAALEWAPAGSRLAVHSDSELTVRILQGRYKAKANPDIWAAIRSTIADKKLVVQADWVRGHAGDPRNELADRLTKIAATKGGFDGDIEALDLSAPVGRTPPRTGDLPSELAGLEPKGKWEEEFVRSLAKQLRGKRELSPKQQAVVDKIRARGTATKA